MSGSFKAFVVALSIAGMLRAANFVSINQNQFEDWQKQAQGVLENAANKAGIKPGERYAISLDVCIDNHVTVVAFRITGGQDGVVYVDQVDTSETGDECNPSTDLHGGNLSSPAAIQAIQNRINQIIGSSVEGPVPFVTRKDSQKAVPSTNFVLLPPFRDLPFPPVYSTSTDFSSSLACNPVNNATTIQVHHSSDTVSINRGCSGQAIATISVGSAPLQVDVTPDGSSAVVTCFDNEIDFIDLTTNTRAAAIQTTQDIHPSGVAISPDGSTAYVTSFTSRLFGGTAVVVAVNIAQRKITSTIPVSDFPQSVFVTPDGSQAWVTHPFSVLGTTLEVIDTLTNTIATRLSFNGSYGIAFNSTGTRAFITSGASNVAVVDTANFATIATVTVGQGPVDIAIAPEDGVLFVDNYLDESVSLVDAKAYKLLGTFRLPGQPRGLAMVQ